MRLGPGLPRALPDGAGTRRSRLLPVPVATNFAEPAGCGETSHPFLRPRLTARRPAAGNLERSGATPRKQRAPRRQAGAERVNASRLWGRLEPAEDFSPIAASGVPSPGAESLGPPQWWKSQSSIKRLSARTSHGRLASCIWSLRNLRFGKRPLTPFALSGIFLRSEHEVPNTSRAGSFSTDVTEQLPVARANIREGDRWRDDPSAPHRSVLD